jgi:anti-sigma factor RsiW
MANPCDDLIGFIDGELSDADASAFRSHLQACERCSTRLVGAVELSAHLRSSNLAAARTTP